MAERSEGLGASPIDNSRDNRKLILELSIQQVRLLEDLSDKVDSKAGILIGFVGVVLTLALRDGSPLIRHPLAALFGTLAIVLLGAAIFFLLGCLKPRPRRYGPDVAKLIDFCSARTYDETLDAVTQEFRKAWEHNAHVHERKAHLFEWGVRLAVAGILLLVVEAVVVRPLVQCGHAVAHP